MDIAAAVAVTLPADVDHASLGVLGAELRLSGAVDAELGVLAALAVPAPLAADIDHAVLPV